MLVIAGEAASLMDAASSAPRRPQKSRDVRTRPSRRRLRSQLTAWAFIAPVAIYMIVFYAFPLYRNLDLSFRDYTLRSFIDGTAPFVWFDNYVEVIQSSTFAPALINTAVFTIVSIVFQYSIGLALAVFFFKRFPLSATLRALFLVPWLLPLLVSASTWAWMLNSESGVVNAGLAVFGIPQINWLTSPQWAMVSVLIANIWIGIPFNLVILYSGLQNIPNDIYEAASLDGANALADVLAHHLPAASTRLGDHDPARARLHAEGLRHHLDHDPRRPRQRIDHVRDLVVPARLRRRLA